MDRATPRIAAIVPCFRVRSHILRVLDGVRPYVDATFVVDDGCPERTAALVRDAAPAGVRVIEHGRNLGVGAAMVTGYRAARAAGFGIHVKLDGDGQMDPALIPAMSRPLLDGTADYVKGDRLASPSLRRGMPPVRVAGNRLISALTRRMTGDKALTDPMNGYTAIGTALLARLDLDRLDRRFFFETDLLIAVSRLGGRIAQLPMPARYGGERSNLGAGHIILRFPPRIAARLLERLLPR